MGSGIGLKNIGIRLAKGLVITCAIGVILYAGMKIYYSSARRSLFSVQRASLSRAEELWAQNNISDYQMIVQFWFQSLGSGKELWLCELEYRVANQNVTQILDQSNCETGFNPATVEDLFEWTSIYLSSSTCGNNGCVCDGPVETVIEYNQEYGYPELVLPVDLMPEERWRYTDIRLFSPATCHLLGTLSGGFRVVSFTPIKE